MVTRPKRSLWKDYGVAIGVAVAVAFGIRAVGIEAYRIPTRAMSPALEPGDTIFVAKWPFGLQLPFFDDPVTRGRMPHRGEVILYSPGPDYTRYFLKRVVALPGEIVQVRKGRLLINGRELPMGNPVAGCGMESHPDGVSYTICRENPPLEDFGPEKVAEGSVFVLGDFRSQAVPGSVSPVEPRAKARSWGPVKRDELRGSALWIWMSVRPRALGEEQKGLFPQLRLERMFRRIP